MAVDKSYRTWEEPAEERPADAEPDGGRMHAALTPPLTAVPSGSPRETCSNAGCPRCADL